MSSNSLFERFVFYLKQLEVWKVEYPYTETHRLELPGSHSHSGMPDFALPVSLTPERLVFTCIDWLDQYIIDNIHFNSEQKANFVYTVFDCLDVTLLRCGVKQLMIHGDPALFINPFRYWKSSGPPRPLSSSTHSFETFGLCDWDKHCGHVVLSELVPNSGDPLRKIPTLNIGLFPLSNDWNIQWKYTKLLNATRKTHGFVAGDTRHPDRQAELGTIVNFVQENRLHIACFPELMLRIDDTKDLWNRLLAEYVEPAKLPFFLLVGGSFHVPVGNHFVNQMPLSIYCMGQTFQFSYGKLEPFSIGFDKVIPRDGTGNFIFTDFPDWSVFHQSVEARSILQEYGSEDIEHDPGITILETDGFGRFGFAICKDVLPDQSKILRQYGNMIDHLVVISLNFSDKADFSTIAGQLALKRGIATFYTNAHRYDPDGATPTFYTDIQNDRRQFAIRKVEIGPGQIALVGQLEQKGMPSRRTL